VYSILTHIYYFLSLFSTENKLADSTAANRALSAQLENIAPQLSSLEASLTESRRKLKDEQQQRRTAEQAQDEADQRIRELEESIAHAREEADAVHEELAFKENELEETRLELEVEKQGLENEIQQLKARLATAEARNAARETSLMDDATNVTEDMGTGGGRAIKSMDTTESGPSVDEAYVKKLEEELELVTEQLIETETRLSESEAATIAMTKEIQQMSNKQRSEEDDEELRRLQSENADQMEREQRLRKEVGLLKEELVLAKEEIHLIQEELSAAEEDRKNLSLTLDEERAAHKEEVTQLSIIVKEAEIASKSSLKDASNIAQAVQGAERENQRLHDEVMRLEAALQNSKNDYDSVLDELEAVNSRFDEARLEAEQSGRDAATGELREQMQADMQHEISNMKSQLETLQQENLSLQAKVDETEMSLAALKDSQDASQAGEQVQTEVVKQLSAQLERAREELSKKEAEISAITTSMEERVKEAEDKTSRLESDLRTAKGQLAETEARVIVLRREKEETQNSIPPPSPKHARKTMADTSGARGVPSPSATKSSSFDREELSSMDDAPTPRRLRTPTKDRPRSTSPASVIRLTYKLDEEQKKYIDLEKEYNKLQDQKRMGEVRIKRLEDDLRLLHKEIFGRGGDTAVVTQMTRLSSLATSDSKEVDLINHSDEDETKHVLEVIESRDPKLMSEELRSLSKKLTAQRDYNAQLLNKMLHLQGNIQVYCRVRPMTISELKQGYKEIVEALSETEIGCFDARTNKWKSFAFDRVWGNDQSQTSVFQDVEPLALSVVDGFNACIFAYGQTGSGKVRRKAER
jgi:kinesin family protein C2/C3